MLIRAVLLCLLLLPMGWLMAAYSGFSSVVLQRVESQYGAAAKRRVLDWEGVMTDSTLLNAQESTKLRAVNDFFNKVCWLDDLTVWGKNDYWATPLEFLASCGYPYCLL